MLVILIVLYVGSQLALDAAEHVDDADRTQRMIFLALPFIFVTFVIQFPAGLLVYWITTNLWTIVQQLIIRSGSGRCARRAPGDGAAGRPVRRLLGGGGLERRRTGRSRPRRGRRRRPRSAAPSRRAGRRGRRRRRHARRRNARGDADERFRGPRARPAGARQRRAGAPGDGRTVSEEGREIRGRRSRAMTSGCSSAATARRSTPSSTSRSRPRRAITRRPRACAWSSTPPATASAASRRSQRQADEAAADAVRSEPPGRAGRDERHRAQGRPRVPQGPRRRRDLLRGHRARPPPRRGARST